MLNYKFKKLPANLSGVNINRTKSNIVPNDIYEYATAFRSVFTRSMPMLKRIKDIDNPTLEEHQQLYGKAQTLAVQIAMSNELLIKAILLGSGGGLNQIHDLKALVGSLDRRYVAILKKYLVKNGLKPSSWGKVLEISALTFVDARYGFENKEYKIDYLTLVLLNEALDDIFNNYLPDWNNLTSAQQQDKTYLKKEVNKIFEQSSLSAT